MENFESVSIFVTNNSWIWLSISVITNATWTLWKHKNLNVQKKTIENLKQSYNLEIEALKNKHLEEINLRNQRSEVYKNYFSKLDSINSELYQNQAKVISEEWPSFVENLINNRPQSLIQYQKMMKAAGNALFNWVENYNRLRDELTTIRLYGSTNVKAKLEIYEQKFQEVIQQTMLFPIVNILDNGLEENNFDTSLSYHKVYEELQILREELHNAMRLDLGIKD